MPESQDVVSDDQRQALDVARQMISAGIPVFAAPPCPAAHGGTCERPGHATGAQEYDLPKHWQNTIAAPVNLEKWRPGWALAAIGGHAADFIDIDPRNGGEASMTELEHAGHFPRTFGVAETPSGGWHYLISPLRERKATGVLPGIDYQGGAAETDGRGKHGRAFVWIAPTVRRSKVDGQRRAYRWLQVPDLDYLADFADGADDSGQGFRDRLISHLTSIKTPSGQDQDTLSRGAARAFTEAEARAFCDITLQRLMRAEIGEIEEAANAAACQLSRFVPEFWSADFAHGVLMAALGETAYDPSHPASGWTADKFRDVLAGAGGRAPDDWHAIRKPEVTAEAIADVATEPDDVDALLAEMLSPEQIAQQPAPQYLVKGLLTLDSESWLIGEPGSKKSFVALDLAGHVANGRAWQGHKVHRSRVVMIVAEGAGGVAQRIRAWEKTYGQMGPDVFILPRPVQAREISRWAVLVEACRRLRPGLVVIDTQARVTVGLEENSATDMGAYVEAVRAVREATGACVLTVHHTGRRGGDARGSSAIDGAQSTELKVRRVDAVRGELITEKQKDLQMADPVPLLFESVTLELDEDGEPVTSLVLCADPFRIAAGEQGGALDHGQVEAIREPQPWVRALFDHPRQETRRRILQALVDAGGQVGVTEARCMALVAERWHGGKVGRGQGALKRETFTANWSALLTHVLPDGELLIVNPSGEKRAVNPAVSQDR